MCMRLVYVAWLVACLPVPIAHERDESYDWARALMTFRDGLRLLGFQLLPSSYIFPKSLGRTYLVVSWLATLHSGRLAFWCCLPVCRCNVRVPGGQRFLGCLLVGQGEKKRRNSEPSWFRASCIEQQPRNHVLLIVPCCLLPSIKKSICNKISIATATKDDFCIQPYLH